METHAFASLAHIQILLIPAGPISQASFEKYAAEIRSFETVRLGDLPENKDAKARFMPKGTLPSGHLHLSFVARPPPRSHAPLALLRPSHFPLAVVGLGSCSKTDSLPATLSQFNRTLLDLFPADGSYPLARNCFVFEEADGKADVNLGEVPSGIVVIPEIMGNKKLYLGTLLADLCSNILGEFATLYQRLESPLGNEYLNGSLLPSLPFLSDIPAPLDSDPKEDTLPPLPSHNSQPDFTRSSSTPPSLKRNSSAGAAVRQSTLGLPPHNQRKRASGIGTASSHGRLLKVLADLFLLAGRTEDAAIWYNEALQMFKPSLDAVWQASALEGLATVAVLDAWSSGYGLQSSTSSGKEPWSEVADKLIQATTLYSKSPTTDSEHHYSLLAFLYCSCVLHHTSLLFAIWSAKGWGPLAFAMMLQPGSKPYLPPTLSDSELSCWSHLERLSSISGISRATIASTISQLHGPWLLHLGPRERIVILEAMASIFSCLGYRRKEAYVLREVLGCIMDLIVCGREEDGMSQVSAESAARMVDGPLGPSIRGQVGIRLNESTEGNDSVLMLLKYICRILGIDLETVDVVVSDDSTPAKPTDDDAVSQLEPFGWPELQVGVVREAVAVAESLPDFLAVARFSFSSLRLLQSDLSTGDQFHLFGTANRALATARRRGFSQPVQYWSGSPVVAISLASLPLIRLPVEKPMSALNARTSDHTLVTGGTDPFLYNPRRAAASQGPPLVVQNEILEFEVILQNQYVFDLEIEDLSISTSGVAFDPQPVRVVLPPTSYYSVTLVGKALGTGTLTIRGCSVRAPGSASREFTLPYLTEEERQKAQQKRTAVLCDMGRLKYSGLDCLPQEQNKRRKGKQTGKASSEKFLECKVVPEQPLLRIRRTNVTRGALMLYDGEISTIRMTIENVSSLMIDFVHLAFDDSTIAPAQQALSEGEMSVFDTYETEHDLIHRPMFTWDKADRKTILPGEKLTLSVTCQGKVGCTNGTIYVSYSYISRPQGDSFSDTNVFHTRQISYPLLVTVYQMLECHSMDILPLPSMASSWSGESDDEQRYMLSVDNDPGWCLFSVDVRNTYGTPFSMSIERVQKDVAPAKSTAVVPPGSTSRLIIPLKKFLLPEEQTSKPVPTLSDRQFVVNKSKLSDVEEKQQRELFWYREELLKCIRCTWQEAGGTRSGTLSLRKQRLTLPMLEVLRTEAADVRLTLIATSLAEVRRQGDKYHPPFSDFVCLRTTVRNMTATPLLFSVSFDLQPNEHVLYEGVPSAVPVGLLSPGELSEVSTPLAFMAFGRYEIRASVQASDDTGVRKGGGVARLTAVVQEGDD